MLITQREIPHHLSRHPQYFSVDHHPYLSTPQLRTSSPYPQHFLLTPTLSPYQPDCSRFQEPATSTPSPTYGPVSHTLEMGEHQKYHTGRPSSVAETMSQSLMHPHPQHPSPFNHQHAAALKALPTPSPSPVDATVAQALEIARESPDGAQDATISRILETALSQIWGRVMAQPESYVMTRDEFSVFNFFQHRFVTNSTAKAARRRFWDNAHA